MKTFKKIAIIITILIVIGFAVKYYMKIRDISKLRYRFLGFAFTDNIKSLDNLLKLFSSLVSFTLPAKITIAVDNPSQSNYTVNNLYAEVFSNKGDMIAKPNEFFKDKVVIAPNQSTELVLSYDLSLQALYSIALEKYNQSGGDIKATVTKLLIEYAKTGKMGTTILLKGFLNAEGLKLIDIKINELIEI